MDFGVRPPARDVSEQAIQAIQATLARGQMVAEAALLRELIAKTSPGARRQAMQARQDQIVGRLWPYSGG